MEKQKRVAAIHDISGFGKCSLTVALPVISAAGIETSVIPTAVLSTHTGGISGYTCCDLTDEMPKIIEHWSNLDLRFNAIYSGYLASKKQIDIVCLFLDRFNRDGCFAIVDPAMADNGKMYALFDKDFAIAMRRLCQKADIIVPNMTEALFMLQREYQEGPYTKEFIQGLLHELSLLGPKKIVLTGVHFDNTTVGTACYDNETNTVDYVIRDLIDGMYHGTGDVFASALTAALVRKIPLKKAVELAVDLTVDSIRRTAMGGTDHLFGVDFERGLKNFIETLDRQQ